MIRCGRGRVAIASGKIGDPGVSRAISTATVHGVHGVRETQQDLKSRSTCFAMADVFELVAITLPGEVAPKSSYDSPAVRE